MSIDPIKAGEAFLKANKDYLAKREKYLASPQGKKWLEKQRITLMEIREAINEANAELKNMGFDPPGNDIEKWAHLARIIEKDPNPMKLWEIVEWARAWIDRKKIESRLTRKPLVNVDCVFDPERKILVLKGKPLALESNEEEVLKALVDARAITLQELRNKSLCPQANKVLTKLLDKYHALKKFIFLPGSKGKGGYSTTIRLTE
ncbi:MAG: hypothetical protein ABSE63_11740 [Thermoguttaceae bacterium]|jgi:hypothetical protein